MENNLDLDIDLYNDKELLNIFNCTVNDNSQMIQQKYDKKLESLETISDINLKSKLIQFFQSAYYKILKNTHNKNTIQNKVFKNKSTVFETVNTTMENTKIMHPSPPIKEPDIQPTYTVTYPKGNINPIDKKITSEILCIDTVFRDYKKYPESTDFVYELPNPIDNVISMKLLSAEIPKVANVFSSSKNNDTFEIIMYNGFDYSYNDTLAIDQNYEIVIWKEKKLTIQLPKGSPTFSELLSSIQTSLDTQRNSFSLLRVDIDPANANIFFRLKTLLECYNWNESYFKEVSDEYQILTSSTTIDNRKRTNYFRVPTLNSDYTLQYDELEYIYKGYNWAYDNCSNFIEKITTQTEIDFKKYKGIVDPSNSYIAWDLYHSNPKNVEPMSYSINFNPNNIPVTQCSGWIMGFRQYVKKNTLITPKIYPDNCSYRNNIKYIGFLNAESPYGDAEQSYNYIYVNDFVGNYNDTLNVAIKNSYFTKSILAKIQMNAPFFSIRYIDSPNENSIMEKKREYFGPVSIKKLHFKIIDKYNKTIDISKANYSLTLQFEKLYNNVKN